ncbi:hypothetical protein [Deinococcus sp. QL22]|uniref:hypothetical protein n=1 Tax=Deinococcus sp. QL22 TaxID=2939437 RepID=UPI00201711B5|nr:hypothetical protein [Deinococcus sp. QL22]UQN06286.1 hypothetical protein M1R55_15725 [Deinococcus sp. QL22]
MSYIKLSVQIQKLSEPQRSDMFVKQFRSAVREGKFDALELPDGKFELPKQFTRRGTGGEKYSKTAKDMLFEATPEFEAWFAATNTQLLDGRKGTRAPVVSVENIESGAVDFKALAAATRQSMESKYQRGQTLGQSRKKSKSKGQRRK